MTTRLPSAQIESFMVLARELNFSRAAELLHITQPALTKRIQNLEETLGQVLFLRLRGGLELTESGRILQRYGSSIEHQEQEVLDSLVGDKRAEGGIAGFFRIAAFSSSLRSVVVPALGVLLRENPRLTCQTIKAEVHELHDMLIEGKIDFCVSLSECERMGVENAQIGVERNVLIESARFTGRPDCYIDHEPRDNFTERFFLSQTGSTVPKMQRVYFDDIYGLIDAVSQGIGRAVVPVHLIRPEHEVRAVAGYRPFEVPVLLQFHKQPYYTKLQRAVIDTLTRECPPLLSANRMHGKAGAAVADDALIAANRRRMRSGDAARADRGRKADRDRLLRTHCACEVIDSLARRHVPPSFCIVAVLLAALPSPSLPESSSVAESALLKPLVIFGSRSALCWMNANIILKSASLRCARISAERSCVIVLASASISPFFNAAR